LYNYTKNHLLTIAAVSALILLLSCAEPDGPVGSDVGGGISGEDTTAVIFADKDTCLATSPVSNGSSQQLYVGSAYGVDAVALVKFNQPVNPFEWSVDSSRIELVYQGGFGEGVNPDVTVEQIDMSWSEGELLDTDSIPAGTALPLYTSPNLTDTGFVHAFPDTGWIGEWLNWVDSSGIDDGWDDTTRADGCLSIMLKADNAVDRLVRFKSRSAIEDSATGNIKPRLYIFMTVRDSTEGELHPDTIEVFSSNDLYIVDYDTTVGFDDLFIGSGVSYRSFVHFGLGMIDTTAYRVVVNRSVLSLHRKQFENPWQTTRSIWPFKLVGDTVENFREVEWMNIVNSSTAIDTSEDEVDVLVTVAAADWLSTSGSNTWLALRSGAEGSDIDRIAFYPAAADSAHRPKLTIHYTRFPR